VDTPHPPATVLAFQHIQAIYSAVCGTGTSRATMKDRPFHP
jgi:hypothetical protein